MKDHDSNKLSVDWKKFGSIDLKKLSEDIRSNHSVLNELAAYIASCAVDTQFNTENIDQNFVKLFKCSQVLIEYLLSEYNRFKSSENERKSCNNLVKENKKLRKLLEIQQKAMTYSRTFDGGSVQCPHCPKVFFDTVFLKTHINRRHPNTALDSEGMLPLTNKIQEYEKFVVGDKGLDKLKLELQDLTEKLAKTESNLMHEKEERLKLEKRMENVLKVRDKELHQTIKEELEELKFVQRERDIERRAEKSYEPNAEDSNSQTANTNEVIQRSRNVLKIEEMIAIQAKEMTKLGNNFEKLVFHLTDSPEKYPKENKKSELKLDFDGRKNKFYSKQNSGFVQIEKDEKYISPKKFVAFDERKKASNESPKRKDMKSVNEEKQEVSDYNDMLDEIEKGLDEKLSSLGIDVNANKITDQEISIAQKKVSDERLLAIQQNRHDFNYEGIEQQIKGFLDRKVNERLGKTIEESNKTIPPKPKERRRSLEKISTGEESPQRLNQQSVEAIVHSSPQNEERVMSSDSEDSESDSDEDVESVIEKKPEVSSVPQTVVRKSVLKPIISDRKTGDVEVKAQQRRIRFSEHRTEYQISPEESSEETSEEYNLSSNYLANDEVKSDSPHSVPIPAQRIKKDEINRGQKEDSDKEINDYMMGEIESQSESSLTNRFSDSHQTKVQELAEMIEKQLSKRSATQKKPPIGSVNVMTAQKESASLAFDSDDSD